MMLSMHASIRSQQRGIPPLILDWLELYGKERYDGNGGLLFQFDSKSIRAIERAIGREPVRRLSEYFDAYKVVSSHDGHTITVGRLHKRINRP